MKIKQYGVLICAHNEAGMIGSLVRSVMELGASESEARRLGDALVKQGEDSEAAMAKSGGEREAVLASQLSQASGKVRELEKQVEDARGAAVKAAKSSAAVDMAVARAEAAESEAGRLREDATTANGGPASAAARCRPCAPAC